MALPWQNRRLQDRAIFLLANRGKWGHLHGDDKFVGGGQPALPKELPMYVVVVDIFAFILFVAGVSLVVRSIRMSGVAQTSGGSYGLRIGGTMVAALGLALGMMVTLFHFASAG